MWFDERDIDWLVIERQLEDWSDLFRAGKKLRIEISFICKDTRASMITRSGRDATGAQLVERNGIIEGQQAAGQPTVWAAVYQLMRCSWKLVEKTALTPEGVLEIRRTHPMGNRWNQAMAVGLRHDHDISFIATQRKSMALVIALKQREQYGCRA